MSKTILVTGCNGQLGTEIRLLAANPDNNCIFTDVNELDITNCDAVMSMVKDKKVDVIINCAAYTNVDKAEDDKETANLINNVAVGYLAKAAAENNATLIHISTDYVFNGKSNVPYTEDKETAPIGVYGKTKLDGEIAIKNSGCNYIIIRTSWLYSTGGNNFVNTMKRLTHERDSLTVIFDQIGTPTNAADLVDAIKHILEEDMLNKKGIYHFSNEGVCSWYDFACEIRDQYQHTCDITPIHSCDYPSRVTRPHYSVLDKTKFKQTFDVKIPHWKQSLKKSINHISII